MVSPSAIGSVDLLVRGGRGHPDGGGDRAVALAHDASVVDRDLRADLEVRVLVQHRVERGADLVHLLPVGSEVAAGGQDVAHGQVTRASTGPMSARIWLTSILISACWSALIRAARPTR